MKILGTFLLPQGKAREERRKEGGKEGGEGGKKERGLPVSQVHSPYCTALPFHSRKASWVSSPPAIRHTWTLHRADQKGKDEWVGQMRRRLVSRKLRGHILVI